jgi:menaquinone-dependent protoporphyrinogen IX oxidase
VFEEIKKDFERVKVEVQAKKELSVEDIQELLVKTSMEYSHYTAFVQKFVISMEEYQKCNIALNIKKAHMFNSKEEKILLQYEAWTKHFRRK